MNRSLSISFLCLLTTAAGLQAFGKTSKARDLLSEQIDHVMKNWKLGHASKYDVEVVENSVFVGRGINAKELAIGPCRYNEDTDKVEVHMLPNGEKTPQKDSFWAECVSIALANAHYPEIESAWLNQLNEHEGWIVENGKMKKISTTEAKLEAPAAQMLWAETASRELQANRVEGVEEAEEDSERKPASEENDRGDAEVRKLLGL